MCELSRGPAARCGLHVGGPHSEPLLSASTLPAISVGGPGSVEASRFYELLQLLSFEHKEEVNTLRSELSRLRCRLPSTASTEPDYASLKAVPPVLSSPVPQRLTVSPNSGLTALNGEGGGEEEQRRAREALNSGFLTPSGSVSLSPHQRGNNSPDGDRVEGGYVAQAYGEGIVGVQDEKEEEEDDEAEREEEELSVDSVLEPVMDHWRTVIVKACRLHESKNTEEILSNFSNQSHDKVSVLLSKLETGEFQEVSHSTGWWWWASKITSHPTSSKRLTWDTFAVGLIGYEMVVFPMSAFSPDPNLFVIMMGWITAVFWLLDMPSQFFVGFFNAAGVLEMRPSKTIPKYVKSWFTLDFMIVSTDWTMIILKSSSDLSALLRMAKSLRVIRILKALRVVRIGKAADIFQKILDRSGLGESVMISLRIVKLLVLVIFINHFVACLWYGLGTTNVGDSNWVDTYKVREQSLLYRYSISLHWSLSQLTPGSNEVAPQNEIERLFALFMLIGGMVGFSSFVSNITSQMTQLRTYNQYRTTQHYNLRRFLEENMVPTKLSGQVYEYLRANEQASKARVQESETRLLDVIPESIMIELHMEVYSMALLKHPLFLALAEKGCMSTFSQICHKMMSVETLLSKHLLFLKGETGKQMSFVISGRLEYSKRRPVGLESPEDAFLVGAGEWVGEPLLWDSDWIYAGFLIAADPSYLFHLEVAAFRGYCLKRGVAGCNAMNKYGERFLANINQWREKKALRDDQASAFLRPAGLFHSGSSLDLSLQGVTDLPGDMLLLQDMANDAFPSSRNSAIAHLGNYTGLRSIAAQHLPEDAQSHMRRSTSSFAT